MIIERITIEPYKVDTTEKKLYYYRLDSFDVDGNPIYELAKNVKQKYSKLYSEAIDKKLLETSEKKLIEAVRKGTWIEIVEEDGKITEV
jgi:5-methylcytosine-specific restriction endonuclease McrBC GTP-binding regulatory subunit McrB